jgi:hypothetical protein
MADLVLPEPIGKQPEILGHPSTRKVLRIGRRGSKTRTDFLAAVCGHGPGWQDGTPALPGIMQGVDVVWVSSDYPNLVTVVWNELIVPRFGHLAWASLNKNEHTLSLTGLGTLYLRPETAIEGVRGMGSRLGGVILDEAAHWDLGGALRRVVLPALLDNRGWAIISSTTNLGWDGNPEREVPSYFNRLCTEIRNGERAPEWCEWTGTAYDNPALDRTGIDEMVAEYDPDSVEYKQEVLAELLTGGAGLALPNADKRLLTQPFPVPSGWTRFGGFDWGFNHPFAFGAFAKSPDGIVYLTHVVTDRHMTPVEIAAAVNRSVDVRELSFIVGGSDCWNVDQAKGVQVPTFADQLAPLGWKLTPVKQDGRRPRAQRLDNLRRYCGWGEGATLVRPTFQIFDHEGGRMALKALSGMLLDPNDPEVPLKVDADAKGRGGDDLYDMVSYALSASPIVVERPTVTFAKDRSPGYDYAAHKPRERLTADQEVALMLERAHPRLLAGRNRVPRR